MDANLELSLLDQGYETIIGIDEVGRGAWAGPVMVGAFFFHQQTQIIPGINDSKQLTPKARELYFAQLSETEYKIYERSPIEIDAHGITMAIKMIIQQIIDEHHNPKAYFLLDGRFTGTFPANLRQVIKGDAKHYSIAAAAVAAKVTRDKRMQQLHLDYPQYGFDRHVGYGTSLHQIALATHGPCVLHRQSYKPVGQAQMRLQS